MKSNILFGIALSILVAIGAGYYIISFQNLSHVNINSNTVSSQTNTSSINTTKAQINITKEYTNNIQLIPNKAFYKRTTNLAF